MITYQATFYTSSVVLLYARTQLPLTKYIFFYYMLAKCVEVVWYDQIIQNIVVSVTLDSKKTSKTKKSLLKNGEIMCFDDFCD